MLLYFLLPHSPGPPALPCAMSSQFLVWPSGFKFGSGPIRLVLIFKYLDHFGSGCLGTIRQTAQYTVPNRQCPSSAGTYVVLCQPKLHARWCKTSTTFNQIGRSFKGTVFFSISVKYTRPLQPQFCRLS